MCSTKRRATLQCSWGYLQPAALLEARKADSNRPVCIYLLVTPRGWVNSTKRTPVTGRVKLVTFSSDPDAEPCCHQMLQAKLIKAALEDALSKLKTHFQGKFGRLCSPQKHDIGSLKRMNNKNVCMCLAHMLGVPFSSLCSAFTREAAAALLPVFQFNLWWQHNTQTRLTCREVL